MRSRPVTLLVALAVGVAFVAGLLLGGTAGGLLLLLVAAVMVTVTLAAHRVRHSNNRHVLRLGLAGLIAILGVAKLVGAI